MDKKMIFIAGTFDDSGGNPSKIARTSKIARIVHNEIHAKNMMFINGGTFDHLKTIIKNIKDYYVIFWFANVSNDKPKLVQDIKKIHKRCILITSKRNVEKQYDFADLVFHALNLKSNLVVEFTKQNGRYNGRLFDPLGNVFIDYTEDFSAIGKSLHERIQQLTGYTRVGSTQVKLNAREVAPAIEVPNEQEFFAIIKHYAEVFHDLIHANPNAVNRFFGNASFRCERGFPSFKHGNLVFVSRRNVDKRYIDAKSFVAVRADITDTVEYYGDVKPSVDTPIQLRLYDYYKNVTYMLHSHVYVKYTPFTKTPIPCGSIEEFNEIIDFIPDRNAVNFAINLRGHGSLVLVNDLDNLKNIPYVSRTTPELASVPCEILE